MAKNKVPKSDAKEILEGQKDTASTQSKADSKIHSGARRLKKKQLIAAQLVADGDLSEEKIAKQLKIGRTTLQRWSKIPEFVSHVGAIREAFAERILKQGLAKKENRIAELSAVVSKVKQVIQERAEEAAQPESKLHNVPGAETGLIVMTFKGLSKEQVAEVDTGTMKELRAALDQISVEVGDKLNKSEVKINDAVGERIERAQARARKALEASGRLSTINASTAVN